MAHSEFKDRIPAEASVDSLLDALKWDARGLLSVVVQDADTKDVLMVAFSNREAIKLTIEKGMMHYYSRSRNKLWMKGEESGHTQKVMSMHVDCDGDAILAQVKQDTGACHLGYRSCFNWKINSDGSITVTGEQVFDPAQAYKKAA